MTPRAGSQGSPEPRPALGLTFARSLAPVWLLWYHDLKAQLAQAAAGAINSGGRAGWFSSQLCATHGRHELRPKAASAPAAAQRSMISPHRDGGGEAD